MPIVKASEQAAGPAVSSVAIAVELVLWTRERTLLKSPFFSIVKGRGQKASRIIGCTVEYGTLCR